MINRSAPRPPRCVGSGHLDPGSFPRKDVDTRFYKCSRSASTHEPGTIRCPHYPRQINADQLEATIWGEVRSLLTDPHRLRQAAETQIATTLADAPIRTTQRATIAHRLDL